MLVPYYGSGGGCVKLLLALNFSCYVPVFFQVRYVCLRPACFFVNIYTVILYYHQINYFNLSGQQLLWLLFQVSGLTDKIPIILDAMQRSTVVEVQVSS